MTPNDSNSYITYLNKLENGCNNNYQHFINNKLINADSSSLPEKFETNPKAPKFKVNDRVRITKFKNSLSKSCTENWSREILIQFWKLLLGLKDLNGEKVIGSFYEKKLLRSKL